MYSNANSIQNYTVNAIYLLCNINIKTLDVHNITEILL